MSEIVVEREKEEEESQEDERVPSRNHGVIQLRLGARLLELGEQYNAATDVSLDMSLPERQQLLEKYGLQGQAKRELRPDLVFYYTRDFDYVEPWVGNDVLRVLEVPLLCIEIISPSQTSREIIDKFRVYFELGVKSCWLVDPLLKLVKVYSSLKESSLFEAEEDLCDQSLGINLPLAGLFSPRQREKQTNS